ncbi:hypothetical protein MKW98_002481 [Papaver atlanticum]|uniref:Uncharacterized protein n=1 Tax=Papaver atlanticum TaxID=357466 RepID=A0AAD4SBG8_9MAGN|nr:hypothetical protein MKW98_002481 [Papaver atlanticum]
MYTDREWEVRKIKRHNMAAQGLTQSTAISEKGYWQYITAAKGSEICVVLLLDYEADPNSRGGRPAFF